MLPPPKPVNPVMRERGSCDRLRSLRIIRTQIAPAPVVLLLGGMPKFPKSSFPRFGSLGWGGEILADREELPVEPPRARQSLQGRKGYGFV